MKVKDLFVCANCQLEDSKWTGKCPSCGAWNSFEKRNATPNFSHGALRGLKSNKLNFEMPIISGLKNIKTQNEKFSTEIQEFDRAIGGGITPGSLTLISGEPGIGKSTLVLQIAHNLSKKNKILLISGEESVEQISLRYNRLAQNRNRVTYPSPSKNLRNLSEIRHQDDLQISPDYGVEESIKNTAIDKDFEGFNLQAVNIYNLEQTLHLLKQFQPRFFILDSIQMISSMDILATAGSISQIRYCTERIMEFCKEQNIACLLIGHVNKEGNLAGPKVLEHLVDTVMNLEGDRYQNLRLLRCAKNRFGSCDEVGVFEMSETGMNEVKNPSALFLEERAENAIGNTLTVALEGNRPFLIEVQALVSPTHFGYPKRTANGFDLNRLQILIAVLEKYAKLNLQNQDIFINVVGGIRLKEPSADLAILLAIASSYFKKALPANTCAFGEIGLSGELRKVTQQDKREKEAQKIGFSKIIQKEKNQTNVQEISAIIKKIFE